MIRQLSIRTKLAFAFGFAMCMIVGIGLFATYQVNAVNRVTSEIRENWLPKLQSLAQMREELASYENFATRRTQNLDFRLLAEVGREMTAAAQRFQDLAKAFRTSGTARGEAEAIDDVTSSFHLYMESVSEVINLLNSGETTTALARFENESQSAREVVEAGLKTLAAIIDAETALANQRVTSAAETANLTLGWSIVIAASLTLAGVAWVSTTISSPLLRVSRAMERLTAGDDAVAIENVADRGDEIGILLAAVRGYRDSVVRSRQFAEVAETDRRRLQAAIANLPVGFCMFGPDNQLIVCNDKFREIYRLPEHVTIPGTPQVQIVQAQIESGSYDGSNPAAHAAHAAELVSRREPLLEVREFPDGRTISTIFQPMAGGWLSTHEDITERRRAEAQVRHMARHDALTNLANRNLFGERIESALKVLDPYTHLAVLTIDLDRFKSVNDSLGHPIGDKLLQAVADRLRACAGESDTVARFGGDEFAVVQVNHEQPTASRLLADQIVEALSSPFLIDDHVVSIGASVGVAIAPADGDDSERLLQNADMALYRAKTDGRGLCRFFEAEMDARMQVRRELEKDLREAVARREFTLHYQPIMNLGRNGVSGLEALLRWPHKTRGMISPADFIPLAEETGLIVALGEWVLRQACADAVKWPNDVSIAVNLSPVQFRSRRLCESVMAALAVSGLAPHRLELEITEGVLLSDSEETLDTLHRLRAIGVRIAMDDFGTGYSSLSYLQSFPFDKIKIDASFVRRMANEPSSMAIVRAVTGLGQSLGMGTTAEGVETAEQLEKVRSEGCTEVQGFLFSAAMPASEIGDLIVQLNKKHTAAA